MSKCIICSNDGRYQNIGNEQFQLCVRHFAMEEDDHAPFIEELTKKRDKVQAQLTNLNDLLFEANRTDR